MKLGVASCAFGRLWLLAAVLQAAASHAQVVTNITPSAGPAGLNTAVNPDAGQPNVRNITGGTRSGSGAGPNLFHSFGAFNVGAGDVANFQNDSGLATSNILGRVTGGARSDIYGSIRTTDFGNAHLFLINPAGWVFGPTASLEVGGSFHASTAHYVRLSDGAQFFADPGQPSVLSSAPPVAFGFLGPTAPIEVQGSFLQVPDGETLSMVAERVQIGIDPDFGTPATLVAVSGRVQIGAFASAGEAGIDGLSGSFASLGGVSIVGDAANFLSSVISTSGIGDGRVVIRGGQLFMEAGTIASENFGDLDDAGIHLSFSESINLTAGSFVGTNAFGLGRGGNVTVSAPQVNIDGSFVLTSTFADGGAGAVSFNVGTLAITGGGTVGSSTLGNGPGGDVSVVAQQLISISGRDVGSTPSSITTQTVGIGGSGGITLSAPLLTVSDGGAITSTSFAGPGGHITVSVDQLSITSGGNIRSHAGSDSPGGNISGTVTGGTVITGSDAFSTSGLFSTGCGGCFGKPGDITLKTRTLALGQGALIQSGNSADPQGGNVAVSATESIVISNRAGITTQADTQAVGSITISAPSLLVDDGFISASTTGPAEGGQVSLSAGTVTLVRGAQIASSSEVVSTGSGGNVVITADSVAISGTSPDGSATAPQNTDPSSGVFSTTRGPGDAGQIQISAPLVSISDGGKISVATTAAGDAGAILVNAGTFSITGGARIDSSTSNAGAGGDITIAGGGISIAGAGSGLFSTASGTGNAGNVVANVGNMSVTGGGRIDSSTTGPGAGGAISVSAASQVEISSGGSVRADSLGAGNTGSIAIAAGDRIMMESGSISTRAVTSDGGNITLTAPNIIKLGNSQISTSVQSGTGAGGNIFIDPQFVILTNSTISANAFGGPGGSVTIVADNFLTDASSFVTASSALSTPGTVQIQSPDNNVASDIAQLPRELVDASRLLRGGCAARRTGAPSSFTVVGRGGVPVDPDGYLPSFSASGASVGAARGAAAPQGFALAMVDADCWR